MKYGYPKQIKKLLKICLIVDIIIQLVYQIPFISPGKDTVAYKIFNSLGYTKLLIYDNNGDNIDLDSSGVIEYIGKPLIYFFISLQTIIYNSKDFKSSIHHNCRKSKHRQTVFYEYGERVLFI